MKGKYYEEPVNVNEEIGRVTYDLITPFTNECIYEENTVLFGNQNQYIYIWRRKSRGFVCVVISDPECDCTVNNENRCIVIVEAISSIALLQ